GGAELVDWQAANEVDLEEGVWDLNREAIALGSRRRQRGLLENLLLVGHRDVPRGGRRYVADQRHLVGIGQVEREVRGDNISLMHVAAQIADRSRRVSINDE